MVVVSSSHGGLSWHALDLAEARVGVATTPKRRGSVRAIASLLTGPADSANVTLALPASRIAAASGATRSATLRGVYVPVSTNAFTIGVP